MCLEPTENPKGENPYHTKPNQDKPSLVSRLIGVGYMNYFSSLSSDQGYLFTKRRESMQREKENDDKSKLSFYVQQRESKQKLTTPHTTLMHTPAIQFLGLQTCNIEGIYTLNKGSPQNATSCSNQLRIKPNFVKGKIPPPLSII